MNRRGFLKLVGVGAAIFGASKVDSKEVLSKPEYGELKPGSGFEEEPKLNNLEKFCCCCTTAATAGNVTELRNTTDCWEDKMFDSLRRRKI